MPSKPSKVIFQTEESKADNDVSVSAEPVASLEKEDAPAPEEVVSSSSSSSSSAASENRDEVTPSTFLLLKQKAKKIQRSVDHWGKRFAGDPEWTDVHKELYKAMLLVPSLSMDANEVEHALCKHKYVLPNAVEDFRSKVREFVDAAQDPVYNEKLDASSSSSSSSSLKGIWLNVGQVTSIVSRCVQMKKKKQTALTEKETKKVKAFVSDLFTGGVYVRFLVRDFARIGLSKPILFLDTMLAATEREGIPNLALHPLFQRYAPAFQDDVWNEEEAVRIDAQQPESTTIIYRLQLSELSYQFYTHSLLCASVSRAFLVLQEEVLQSKTEIQASANFSSETLRTSAVHKTLVPLPKIAEALRTKKLGDKNGELAQSPWAKQLLQRADERVHLEQEYARQKLQAIQSQQVEPQPLPVVETVSWRDVRRVLMELSPNLQSLEKVLPLLHSNSFLKSVLVASSSSSSSSKNNKEDGAETEDASDSERSISRKAYDSERSISQKAYDSERSISRKEREEEEEEEEQEKETQEEEEEEEAPQPLSQPKDTQKQAPLVGQKFFSFFGQKQPSEVQASSIPLSSLNPRSTTVIKPRIVPSTTVPSARPVQPIVNTTPLLDVLKSRIEVLEEQVKQLQTALNATSHVSETAAASAPRPAAAASSGSYLKFFAPPSSSQDGHSVTRTPSSGTSPSVWAASSVFPRSNASVVLSSQGVFR